LGLREPLADQLDKFKAKPGDAVKLWIAGG
jgi:hypothetical protein